MSRILSAASALTPDGGFAPLWLRYDAGRILETGTGTPPRSPDERVDSGVLAPGFIDVHAHGAAGASFADGAESARTVLAAHRGRGTTSMLASLVSAPMDEILDQVRALGPLAASAELAGIHLEGPWLSPGHRGAHDELVLADPAPAVVSALLEEPAACAVRYVTMAPERTGALEAISRLSEAGIVVGIGHTGADCAQAERALAAGASAATHLFNGMTGLHHREPGAALALLADPAAHLELIADGVHLHPEMVRYVWNAAERAQAPGRIVLISDAMSAALAHDGEYMLGSLRVQVIDGTARLLAEDGSLGAIAGSTVTLADTVRTAIETAGIPPERALRAATATPADMVGLDGVGRLEPGARADLVVLGDSWDVRRVMYRGEWLAAG